MMDPISAVVFFNGLDFDLHGLSAALDDPNPIQCDGANILSAFQNTLTNGSGNVEDDLKDGNSGTVIYNWNNPADPNDDVPDYLARGVVPGSSAKQSYLKVADIAPEWSRRREILMIFGSGFYLSPDDVEKENCESADDDGGCAIAGTGGALQNILLNLFLVASVLLPAVFLRKRA